MHRWIAIHRRPSDRALSQLLRYCMVVGFGYLLAIAVYSGELQLGIPPYLALGIAFVLNGILNFALLRAWAFPPSGRPIASDLARFCVAAAASFATNYLCFAILYSAIGLAATVSQRLAILIAGPVTFLVNRLWSFRPYDSRDGPQTAEFAPDSVRKTSYSRM